MGPWHEASVFDKEEGREGGREGGEKGKKDVIQPVEPALKREIWDSQLRTLRKQNKPYFDSKRCVHF